MPSFSKRTWNTLSVLVLILLSQNLVAIFVGIRVIGLFLEILHLLEIEMDGNWILVSSEKDE